MKVLILAILITLACSSSPIANYSFTANLEAEPNSLFALSDGSVLVVSQNNLQQFTLSGVQTSFNVTSNNSLSVAYTPFQDLIAVATKFSDSLLLITIYDLKGQVQNTINVDFTNMEWYVLNINSLGNLISCNCASGSNQACTLYDWSGNIIGSGSGPECTNSYIPNRVLGYASDTVAFYSKWKIYFFNPFLNVSTGNSQILTGDLAYPLQIATLPDNNIAFCTTYKDLFNNSYCIPFSLGSENYAIYLGQVYGGFNVASFPEGIIFSYGQSVGSSANVTVLNYSNNFSTIESYSILSDWPTFTSTFPNNLFYSIVSRYDNNYNFLIATLCPQTLFWNQNGCFSNYAEKGPYYYEMCFSNQTQMSSCCPVDYCSNCQNQVCVCEDGFTNNLTSNLCQPCPQATSKCKITGQNYTSLTCDPYYVLINDICCPINSENCTLNGTEITNVNCQPFFKLQNGICCSLLSENCTIENNKIVNKCPSPYYAVENICCPFGTSACSIDPQNGTFISTCSEGYSLNNGICCSILATTCSQNSSGYLVYSSCVQNSIMINGVCCPPFSTDCYVIKDFIVASSCNNSYFNLIDGICCTQFSTFCSLSPNGAVIADYCEVGYEINGEYCCPLNAVSCTMNQNYEIMLTTCNESYVSVNNLCCPLWSSNCSIGTNGTTQALSCLNSNFNLVDGICCTQFSSSCSLIPENATVISETCEVGYEINGEYCCPLNAVSCTMSQNYEILLTTCNGSYVSINNLCCPPWSTNCTIGTNGATQALSCLNSNFNLLDNLCCLQNSASCYINPENGSITIATCEENYSLNGPYCCPLNAVSCSMSSNYEISISSCENNFFKFQDVCCPNWSTGCSYQNNSPIAVGCNPGFVFINGYCCPQNSKTCNLDSEGNVVVLSCEQNYEYVNGLCCPLETKSCQLNNATGEITVSACDDSYTVIDGLCCPLKALSCSLNNGEIIPESCADDFSIIKNLCCPILASSCSLDHDTIVIESCDHGSYLADNTCLECINNCTACESKDFCTQCDVDLFLYDNQCIQTCPAGFEPTNGACCKPECIDCGGGGSICRQCISDYYLVDSNCYSECPAPFVPAAGNLCLDLNSICDDLICNILTICNASVLEEECNIASPIILFAILISAIVSLVKLFLLMKIKGDSVLLKLLLFRAYADILYCLLIAFIFDSDFLQTANILSALYFYGNILGFMFTMEIFLYGFFFVNYGIHIFEKLMIVSIFTVLGSILLEIGIYLFTTPQQSPYFIIGVGGISMLFLGLVTQIFNLKSKLGTGMKYYHLFPCIMALTWIYDVLSLTGILTESLFWDSFWASFFNFLQPVFNAIFYGPLIYHLFKGNRDVITKIQEEIEKSSTKRSTEIEIKEIVKNPTTPQDTANNLVEQKANEIIMLVIKKDIQGNFKIFVLWNLVSLIDGGLFILYFTFLELELLYLIFTLILGGLIILRSACGILAIKNDHFQWANAFIILNVICLILRIYTTGINFFYSDSIVDLLWSYVVDFIFFIYFHLKGASLIEILKKKEN